ncbi:MAG: FUN14 domain-containing protein [Candidatus Bathyarchaeia archaeon]|mgnify:CR=1 FL=1|nr:FUN14 domain-containing protein [Candidatus Bathyarchaeia archaeon]MDI6905123.1 FUN14 domain-containing protein [Candidatus Bathyarchaeia archaeon]
MSAVLPSVVYQLGVGGIGGFIVGYAMKKISKLIVVLIGLFITFLLYLGTRGIISINYAELWKALEGLLSFAGQAATWLIGFISLLPFMGSFIAGFVLGFKLG